MRRIRDIPGALAVYVVTSSGLAPGRGHVEVARAALQGGATAIQLRAPELEGHPDELVELATRTWSYCQQADVPLIVNNALYAAIVADGVHLGQSDQLEGIRNRLGPARIIGVSVETPDQARAAWGEGADYLGVTVFPTATKPEATPVGLGGLHEISAATPISRRTRTERRATRPTHSTPDRDAC